MKIIISSRAEKQLKKLSKVDQIAIARKVRQLGSESLSIGEEKLKGFKNIYRVRVGVFRIVYKKTIRELYLVLIGHRKDVYRLMRQLLD